jgi:RNA polymerase sigma-70 factor, ECF subfamily
MDLSDRHTFEQAYAEHVQGVHAAAYRVLGDRTLAQDVAQDVFLRLWRNPSAYEARRGGLGAYLRLMARSRAIDLHREGQAAGRARDRLVAVAPRDEAAQDGRPAEATSRAEERAEVGAALRVLPPAQREAILLNYWGGLTADQIAQRAAVPLGTAKSRIRLGLAKLREELAAAGGGPDRSRSESPARALA